MTGIRVFHPTFKTVLATYINIQNYYACCRFRYERFVYVCVCVYIIPKVVRKTQSRSNEPYLLCYVIIFPRTNNCYSILLLIIIRSSI